MFLALLAALLYGDHVLGGGFAWDDWENAGTTRYQPQSGFLGPFDLDQAAYRPLLALLIPLPHLAFGTAAAPHLALALALAVAAAVAFHSLLRALGASRAFALAAAALALAFPWSASTRLWATASLNLVAVALILAAGAIALRALAAGEPRRRVALTALMCAAAILTYEAVAGIVLLLPVLYRTLVPWPAAWARWRIEALAGGAALLVVALFTTKGGGEDLLERAATMAGEGAELTGRAIVPLEPVPWLVGVAVVVAALVAWRARWVALSLLALVLAWAPFVPGAGKYAPGAEGIYDRVNIVAGFALAALVCSLAALVRQRAGAAVAVAVVLAVGAGWVVRAREEVAAYERAAAVRERELAAVERALGPAPAPGTVVVLFHEATWVAPGVPGFGQPWDLGPAVRLAYDDPSLAGFPVDPEARVTCGPAALTVDAATTDDPPPAPYARAVLVDARSGRARRVSGARDCETVVAELRPSRASA
jgi:hypothetical protein